MADFTSWEDLLAQIRNSIANRDLAVQGYRTPDGRQVQFRTLAELQAAETWVSERADVETADVKRRGYVRHHGSNW